MIDLIMQSLDFIGENATNPLVRILASGMGAMATAMGYQKIVEKAKIISAKTEQKAVDDIKKKCDGDIEYKTEVQFYNLKTALYGGMTDYVTALRDKGIKTITIDQRDETIRGRDLTVQRLLYNKSIKDIRGRAKARLMHDVKDLIKTERNTVHRRSEAVNEIARDFRIYFFGELHKFTGESKGMLEMENEIAPFECFVLMIESLLSDCEGILIRAESSIEKVISDYKIKTLNIKKIYKTIFHK